MAHPEYGAKN